MRWHDWLADAVGVVILFAMLYGMFVLGSVFG